MGCMIKQYLSENGLSISEAAKELGISRQWLSEVIRSGQISKKLATKVELWSSGKLQAVDLVFPETQA